MKQLRVAILLGFSYLSKLLVSLFIIKQIAATQGVEGLGVLGNFMNLAAIAGTLAGGGIFSGVIKYTAEYSGSLQRLLSFAGSALVYTLVSALITLILGMIFIKDITQYIFMNQDYSGYIYFFLVAQIFISFNNLTYGLINGLKQNSLYAILTITGNIIAAVLAYYMIKNHGFMGAVIAIMAPALCSSIPVFFYSFFNRQLRSLKFDSIKMDSKLLGKFSLMLFFSAACFPIVEMSVRNNIVHFAGLDAAGYWQAITKLSSAYLSFYSLFLCFYFVPVISSEQDNQKIFNDVKKMIFFISCLFLFMIFAFTCLKYIIIELVFTKEFLVVSDLFILQMIGDFFRVIGWVVGFIVVAKALTKLYILGEVIQGTMFIALSSFALNNYSSGLYGVVLSYVVTCFLYSSLVLFLFYYFFCIKTNKFVMG